MSDISVFSNKLAAKHLYSRSGLLQPGRWEVPVMRWEHQRYCSLSSQTVNI